MTHYPELVVTHAPSLGWLTTVFVYRSANSATLAVSAAPGQCGTLRRQLDEAERDELALLIGVLDPHKIPEQDPCAHSMKDGTSWTLLTGLPDRRVGRTRQVTSDPACREVEDAVGRLMVLAGVTCVWRGCSIRAEIESERCPLVQRPRRGARTADD